MKRFLTTAAGASALAVAVVLSTLALSPSAAQTVASEITAVRMATFTVQNMTCALCPVTVKAAMKSVDGVRSVEIDFEAKTATVAFDPSATTIETIAAASGNAGYPARIAGS